MTSIQVYFDPTKLRKPPNLIGGVLHAASHSKQERFEDLISEVLGWLLDRSSTFARSFAELFTQDDPEASEALSRCSLLAAATQVSLPNPHGSGVVRPDLALAGESRRFQLLVEVKVDANFHPYTVEGMELIQPDAYAHAWKHRTHEAQEANVRRVGTLTRDGLPTVSSDPMRGRDVTWDEVAKLLDRLLREGALEPEVKFVATDLLVTINKRILKATVDIQALPSLLNWGRKILKPAVADLVFGLRHARQTGYVRKNNDSVSVQVEIKQEKDPPLRLWIAVTPEGGEYNAYESPDTLWLTVYKGMRNEWRDNVVAAGFEWLPDPYGDKRWRKGLLVDEVQAIGDLDAQAAHVARWMASRLFAARVASPTGIR